MIHGCGCRRPGCPECDPNYKNYLQIIRQGSGPAPESPKPTEHDDLLTDGSSVAIDPIMVPENRKCDGCGKPAEDRPNAPLLRACDACWHDYVESKGEPYTWTMFARRRADEEKRADAAADGLLESHSKPNAEGITRETYSKWREGPPLSANGMDAMRALYKRCSEGNPDAVTGSGNVCFDPIVRAEMQAVSDAKLKALKRDLFSCVRGVAMRSFPRWPSCAEHGTKSLVAYMADNGARVRGSFSCPSCDGKKGFVPWAIDVLSPVALQRHFVASGLDSVTATEKDA